MQGTESDRGSFNDSLGEFLNKENQEKAPEGLTGRIMEIINREKLPTSSPVLRMVPFIAVAVALLLLIISSLVLQDSPNRWFSILEAGFSDINRFFSNITFSFNVSILFVSISIALFLLIALDMALGRYGNKKTR